MRLKKSSSQCQRRSFFIASAQRHRNIKREQSVVLRVGKFAVHRTHKTFGNIQPQSCIASSRRFGIVRIKYVAVALYAFAVVRNGYNEYVFLFLSRNVNVFAAGMFDGIENNIADDRIQAVDFAVHRNFAGRDFQYNAVSAAIRLVILFGALQKVAS